MYSVFRLLNIISRCAACCRECERNNKGVKSASTNKKQTVTPPTPNLGKRWGVFCVSLFHNSRLFIKVRLDKSWWLDCSDGDTFGVDGTHQEGGQRTGVFCLLRHWRVAGQPSAGGWRLCMPFTTVLVLVQGKYIHSLALAFEV